MSKSLSNETISSLPVHDADLLSLNLSTNNQGIVNLRMVLEVNREESMQPFIDIGIQTQLVGLTFGNCRHTIVNLLGYQTQREQIFDWAILPSSDLLTKLRESGFANDTSVNHHRFEFSGGSTLDVLASETFIEEVTGNTSGNDH